MTCKKDLMRRVIAFLGAVVITFNIVAVPQRARAVAVTASVVASVAAIMTACGVSYWAASQTDVVVYLGGKIDAYLASLEQVPVSYEDWLGISGTSQLFEVVSGGVMKFSSGIANKVLDFVRWFNTEEGISSGGDPVSDAVGGLGFSPTYFPSNTVHSGEVSSVWVGTNLLRIDFSNFSGSGGFLRLEGVVDQPGTYGFTVRQVSGVTTASFERVSLTLLRENGYGQASSSCVFEPGYSASTGKVYQWQIEDYGPSFTFAIGFSLGSSMTPATGFCVLELTGKDWYKAATNSFIPSATVSVPDDVAEDDTFDVAPSVPLSAGMSVEDASDAIYGGITSEDGLTAEGDTSQGVVAGWGWLSDLLDRIREAVQGTQEQTAPAEYETIEDYALDLTSFFPFCIPWDLHRGLSLLVAEPEAPSIEWTVPLPNGSTYTLALDLSDFDSVASVARAMELLLFVVALAVATKKLIKW